MIKIAFIGRQRSGKTTGANALKLHFLATGGLDWESTRVITSSFGKAMKEEFELFTGEEFDKREHRKMIQLFGQLHRHYDDYIWIRQVEQDMHHAQLIGASHFIIDDVRQQNEVDFCKENGFILVYVDVPLVDLHTRCLDLEEDFTPSHSTEMVEQFYEDADLRIVNSNDTLIEQFEETLIEMVEAIIEHKQEVENNGD